MFSNDLNETQPCTVSELNQRARQVLEANFDEISVEGEISDLIQHRSGHWYFTLKDESAQLRAAMFRYSNQRVRFNPQNGDHVVIRGKLSIYEARGSYQFIANSMTPAGAGALQHAFEQLKAKLTAEGLFAADRKRALPVWIRRIAVVTSPQGAAFHDIQTTLARRFPSIAILLYPVAVQGTGSAEQIARAIDQLNAQCNNPKDSNETLCLPAVDAILLARGGGSMEDLWSFNEEVVARAIARSQLPVVSAVGHETDFTIADFVADARAATPTAGAELLSLDQRALRQQFGDYGTALNDSLRAIIYRARTLVTHLRQRLRDPRRHLEQLAQQRDFLESRLFSAIKIRLRQKQASIDLAKLTLAQHSPNNRLQHARWRLKLSIDKLLSAQQLLLENHRNHCALLAGKLQIVSPLATLQRGYAIVSDDKGDLLREATNVAKGDKISAQLSRATLYCIVDWVEPKSPNSIPKLEK